MNTSKVTTTVLPSHVLLYCSICGPVGVYDCDAPAAIQHHQTIHRGDT